MSGRVFWVAATILLAVVVHLTYVLFAPGNSVQRKLQGMRTLAGVNSLKVLSANDSRSFLSGEGPGLVHAICVYDLDNGEVKAEAPIPRGYWSVSIYTSHGTNVYTLNDRQAQVDFLSLTLRKASPLRETDNPVGVDLTSRKDLHRSHRADRSHRDARRAARGTGTQPGRGRARPGPLRTSLGPGPSRLQASGHSLLTRFSGSSIGGSRSAEPDSWRSILTPVNNRIFAGPSTEVARRRRSRSVK